MKLKLNLDRQTIQQFFVDHTEKIILGVVVICAALIVYQATGRETFRYGEGAEERSTPEDLVASAERAKKHIEDECPEVPEEIVVTDYNAIVADVIAEPVKEKDYKHTTPWNPPIVEQLGPRPPLPALNVEQLRGSADVGALTMKATVSPVPSTAAGRGVRTAPRTHAMGKTTVRGQHWVVLTGKVPIQKQTEAFEDALRDAQHRDPKKDVVEYRGYWVARMEASSPGAKDNLDWSKATVFTSSREMAKALDQWANVEADVVEKTFRDDRLCFPLPPLKDRQWGPEVAFRPEIPLLSDEAEQLLDAGGDPVERPDDPATPFDEIDRHGRVGGLRRAPVRVTQPEELECLLLRFFDFNVEPGKHYCYRVRVALSNPNYGAPVQYLEDPESGKNPLITPKDWSEPTEVISVPRDTRLLAGSVTAPTRSEGEPLGKALVIKFVQEGYWAQTEQSFSRGRLLNFPNRTYPEISGASDDKKGKNGKKGKQGLPQPIRNPRDATDEPIQVDYITDALALDMWGGRVLPGRDKLIAPGEILLLDPDGSLVVHREMDDRDEYVRLTKGEVEPDAGQDIFAPGPTAPPPDGGDFEGLYGGDHSYDGPVPRNKR